MSVLSVNNHPFPSLLWERIREEVRIFFSLSTPINRTRFWIYPLVWVGIYWSILALILLAVERTAITQWDINYERFNAFIGGQISISIPITIALLIPSIKRLHHIEKPAWLAWLAVTLFCFIPLVFDCYEASTGLHNIDNDWLHIFADEKFTESDFFYVHNLALWGLFFFLLYVGFFPIAWQRIYKYFTKYLIN